MTTHSYKVFEQRYDGMPGEDSRMSGRIGCGGGSTRGTHFFRHDPLEEELDPCLSAAVRYQKEKGNGFIRMRYVLCCLIVILAIALIAFALFPIFGSKHPTVNNDERINTVNGSGNEWTSSQTMDVTSKTEEEQIPTEQTQEVRTKTGTPMLTTTTTLVPRRIPPVKSRPTTTTTKVPRKTPPIKPRPTSTTTQVPRRTSVTTIKTTTMKSPLAPPVPKRNRRVHDCDHHHKMGHKSGVHRLSVDNYEFYAVCEMDSNHGWTTLQRRTDDKLPFWNATFNEYANGFGDIPDGDYWLGLEYLWAIADNRKMEMRIQLEGDRCKTKACSGLGEAGTWWGIWEFTIGSRADAYRISNLKFLRGNLSDATDPKADMFSFLCNNGRFTTVDADNDENKEANCALQRQRGGWWHRDCAYTALNGRYGNVGSKSSGFHWLWKSAEQNILRSYNIKPMKSSILFRAAE